MTAGVVTGSGSGEWWVFVPCSVRSVIMPPWNQWIKGEDLYSGKQLIPSMLNVLKLNQNLSEKSDLLSVKYIFVSVGVNVRFSLAKAAYWCLIRILNNT